MKKEKNIDAEKSYAVSQVVTKPRRLADALKQNKTFEIQTDNNRISVPPTAEIEFEYEKRETARKSKSK